MGHEQKWPDVLWLVRHGQSASNVARDAAEAAGLKEIVLDVRRDMDVPLSELGQRQSRALGHWFAQMPADRRPGVILTSTYVRSRATAELIAAAAGIAPAEVTLSADERLREKEFGILDRLTKEGIRERYPEQYAFREAVGKFYYRPPGGESWCDVILRLRSVLGTLARDYRRERVLIVAHSVVVLCFRYLLERMSEETILDVDRTDDVPNCAVTEYEYDPAAEGRGRLVLRRYNFLAPLEAEGTHVTTSKDIPVAPK
ncbi:MAG TPA: histidine phosphatase family protein [Pyrinomonadaceae bacterium]|jgi:broad specificity phosphatase PhoE